jgi:uncharacterized radical SAM superfamily Fe-S cluster-containing enzyme
MNHSLSIRQGRLLKHTRSLCPRCRATIPAEVHEEGGRVFLRKACREHGRFDVLINSDARFYYASAGASGACCGGACGSAADESAPLIEKAATCIALIEIVETCNLKCPTCYADSPFSKPEEIKALTVEEFWRRIDAVIARKGPLDILQLSGGEPAIHPRFFELFESVLADQRIGYALLNTNGVRLAREARFMERVGELHRRFRRFEVYLQYDGPQEASQRALRGSDLRALREEAIDACARQGVPVTLAMTVTDANIAHLGDAVRFGLSRPNVRGITFQPMFGSGRTPGSDFIQLGPPRRLNVADVVLGLVGQSAGVISERDFTPLPCGDPNCHTIGYLLRRGERVVPVSELVDFASVQGFLKDRVNFNVEDLARCGCESEPLGAILKQLEIGPEHVFRIFIKPFMDVWTYDQDRIDRCCVHVVGEGGRLESFCRHYAMRGSGDSGHSGG